MNTVVTGCATAEQDDLSARFFDRLNQRLQFQLVFKLAKGPIQGEIFVGGICYRFACLNRRNHPQLMKLPKDHADAALAQPELLSQFTAMNRFAASAQTQIRYNQERIALEPDLLQLASLPFI